MAVTSNRVIQLEFTGDVSAAQILSALENVASPGQIQIITLTIGDNEIEAPSVEDVSVRALTIIPPAGNTSDIVLKGAALDAGILLHLTDPTSIALGSTFDSLFLEAEDEIEGVRLIWS